MQWIGRRGHSAMSRDSGVGGGASVNSSIECSEIPLSARPIASTVSSSGKVSGGNGKWCGSGRLNMPVGIIRLSDC